MLPKLPWAAAFLASLAALPSAAILTRPDRDDAEYRELASRYPAAVALGAAAGSGVLIAPRWVLTSARAATALGPGPRALSIAGRRHEIQEVVVHPDWKGGDDADLALLFLREAVATIEPVAIHREPNEEGETGRVVGFGETGRIGAPPGEHRIDGLARAAINTVDRVQARSLGMRIKGPDEASDLQGALAPGDRGAPAFFEARGRFSVAAIAASPGPWETYVRVSAFAAWIDEAMFRAALQEAARDEAARKRKPAP